MRRVFLMAILMLGFHFVATAQVKAGLGLGYASPTGDLSDIADGGVSGYFEIGYGFSENMDASVLWQGDFLVGGDLVGESLENVNISSVLLNGRYFLSESKFKPYAGLGLGLAKISQSSLSINGLNVGGFDESNFAIRPSLGFKYGVLNVNVAYLNAGKIDGDYSVGDITFNVGLLFSF